MSYPDRLRSLPVGNASTREYSWKEACDLVRDMWARLDPAYATMFDDAIASGHVFTGSRRSAACWWAPGQPPFLELNFGGTFRDVVRLAHEYGHYIAARLIFAHQNGLNDNPSVPMCEIPSVVVEQLLIQALDGEAGQADEERLSSLIEQLDRLAGAVFRQTAGTLVELDLYAARRQDGAVSMDRANAIFLARIRDQLMGESVTFENNAELSWMLWPHLMMGFYMPGYIVGSAVATVLTQRVGANPGYIKVVEDLMAVGSSESLEDALQAIGIDIASTQFWDDVLAHGWYDKLRELEALLTRLGYHEG